MRSVNFFFLYLYLFVYLRISLCHPKINTHLRVATFFNPLAKIPNVTANRMGIIESNLLEWLADELNFTYEICVPADVLQIGTVDEIRGNGSWTGALGLLVSDKADMTISFGPEFYSRFKVVDPTVSVILDTISIMVPYPTKNNDASSLFYVFDNLTWILIALSIIVVIITLWMIPRLQQRGERDAGMITILILAQFFAQGGFLRQFSLAPRIVQGAFLLATLVINYTYSGVLISIITAPTLKFNVGSIQDVADDENIRPLMIDESNIRAAFEESNLPTFQTIIQRIKDNPGEYLIPASSNNFVDILLNNPRNVLLMSGLAAKSGIENDFQNNRKCRATLLPKPISYTSNGLFLKKHSPYVEAVNRQLLLLKQAGLLTDYLDNIYENLAGMCYVDLATVKKKGKQGPFPLTLYELRGVFLVFVYCLLFCFLALLCELCYSTYHM